MPLRNTIPQRTCTKKYKAYNSYRRFLQNDFNCTCGYCGEPEMVGYSFHIDHFAPKSLFPDLETVYGNLVYSCPICNMGKSDDWVTEAHNIHNNGKEGYIDPCDASYNQQFKRTRLGKIIPVTDVGKYMHKKFKLSLKRREILWRLTKIDDLLEQIMLQLSSPSLSQQLQAQLLKHHCELTTAFRHDWKRLFTRGQ